MASLNLDPTAMRYATSVPDATLKGSRPYLRLTSDGTLHIEQANLWTWLKAHLFFPDQYKRSTITKYIMDFVRRQTSGTADDKDPAAMTKLNDISTIFTCIHTIHTSHEKLSQGKPDKAFWLQNAANEITYRCSELRRIQSAISSPVGGLAPGGWSGDADVPRKEEKQDIKPSGPPIPSRPPPDAVHKAVVKERTKLPTATTTTSGPSVSGPAVSIRPTVVSGLPSAPVASVGKTDLASIDVHAVAHKKMKEEIDCWADAFTEENAGAEMEALLEDLRENFNPAKPDRELLEYLKTKSLDELKTAAGDHQKGYGLQAFKLYCISNMLLNPNAVQQEWGHNEFMFPSAGFPANIKNIIPEGDMDGFFNECMVEAYKIMPTAPRLAALVLPFSAGRQ